MINFKNLPAIPRAMLIEEEQTLKMYPRSTPCEIIVPLNSIRKVVKTQGNIGQHLDINRFLFKGKMAALIEVLGSKMNPFLNAGEQRAAEGAIREDLLEVFGKELRRIVDIPDNYLENITDQLIEEGYQEAKLFKKVFNSKAYKRYVQTAKDIESCRLQLSELEDVISENERQISELKRQYNLAKEEALKKEIAQKVNDKIDENTEPIKEYNRLLTKIYAPKVAAMKKDAQDVGKHIREVSGIDYTLPAEVFIGKTPKNARDKSYNIIA